MSTAAPDKEHEEVALAAAATTTTPTAVAPAAELAEAPTVRRQGTMSSNSSAPPRLRRPRQAQHQHQGIAVSSLSEATGEECLNQQQRQPHDATLPTPGETASGPRPSAPGASPAMAWKRHPLCPKCDGCCGGAARGSMVETKGNGGAAGENWSLKNVGAWRGGEWLGLLRKRRRSAPNVSRSESGAVGSSRINNIDNNSGSSVCRKQRKLCFETGSSSSDTGSGGSGGASRGRRVLAWSRRLGLAFCLAWLLCLAVREFYIRTYCLQVRAMEATQPPRGECPIVKLTRESRGGWGAPPVVAGGEVGGGAGDMEEGLHDKGSGGAAVAPAGGGREGGGLRFGIILMCDEGMWPQQYSEKSIANKKAYAALHGYDVIVATSADIDRSRPAAWSKLLVLSKHLGSYDYVIFVDIDAFVMNPAFKLEWLLDVARKQQQTGGIDGWGAGKESDLIVTQDWNGPNSGVILIKNSDFSRWLLQEWWDQKQFVNGPYPFHYEQRAMHYLLQTDCWKEEGLPFYADYAVVRAHTAVLDQCAMNSYLVHPWQVLLGRTSVGSAARYESGDFMLHFAGKKGRVRLELVDYYYPRAKKAMEEYAASLQQDSGQANRSAPNVSVGVHGAPGGDMQPPPSRMQGGGGRGGSLRGSG